MHEKQPYMPRPQCHKIVEDTIGSEEAQKRIIIIPLLLSLGSLSYSNSQARMEK